MVDGTVIVVVILKKHKGFDHGVGYMFGFDFSLLQQMREDVPNTIIDIQIVNQEIIQNGTEIGKMNRIGRDQDLDDFITNDFVILHERMGFFGQI